MSGWSAATARMERALFSDETAYRTSGEKRWLWALVAANFVLYKIALTRGALDRYADSPDKDIHNLALALLKQFEKFFAFLRNDAVEPTNNSAQRALRCAVQWRAISFGSRSAQGEVAVVRLLTVTRTCRMQNREPLDYLGG
jgi:hypothetical protein